MNRFSADFPDEKNTWQAIQQGDREAYARLYDHYFDKLYRYGRKITADTGLIEDCIQDLFVSLWRNPKSLTELQTARYYLYKSLRNSLVAQIGRQQTVSTDSPLPEHTLAGNIPPFEHFVIQEETHQYQDARLRAALNELTKREREVIFLKFYAGLSSQEIADTMAIGIPSVYNLVQRALASLQQHLDKILVVIFLYLAVR